MGSDAAEDQDLDHSIPRRLKALRTALGISAATLDGHAGFNLGTTGRLERGDQRVYASHLYRICDATGIAIGYFYNTDGNQEPSQEGVNAELEKQRLLQTYLKIKDPALKRDVFELVETLARESSPKAR